ncbi:MAG: type II toxin-antitoxin system Phd/YefM family antitoxin, partial [Spirochaetales bacterium]|nr:type II toxin-antitoxin system Phd/YefM family antitoxin [Spirochaetales bacterium]
MPFTIESASEKLTSPVKEPSGPTVRDLRNHYAEIEKFLENHDPVIITKNGRGAAVLINIEDY